MIIIVGIYARQSIEKHDSVSIEAQINKCKALCDYNEWEYTVYRDAGYSGKNLNRPEFSKLMNDVKSGKLKKIICYRLDRISRSMADFSQLIVIFEEYGVEFISATENFDTSTPLGRAMVNIIMTFAQLERETITARVKDNYYYRGNKGIWPGGPPPYGYDISKIIIDGKKQSVLVVNPEEAEIVKLFYKWYLEKDGSVRKIITKANKMGIKTRTGSMWTSRVVADMLWKPLYAPNTIKIYNFFKLHNANFQNDISEFDGSKAVNLYGKLSKNASNHKRCREIDAQYLIVSEHEPLIDDTTWLKAQAKKKEAIVSPNLGKSQNSYLTGLLKCGYCGYSVSIMKIKKKTKSGYCENRYYVCSTRKNRGKDTCDLGLINAEAFEIKILKKLSEHYSTDKIKKILSKPIKNENIDKEYILERNRLEIQIANISSKIENLINNLAQGEVSYKYINSRIEKLDLEKNLLEKELAQLEINQLNSNSQKNLEYIFKCAENLPEKLETANFDEMKDICHTLIKDITFTSLDDINITFTL